MSAMPKVSLIIPTRNRCVLLAQALDSALAQTYPNMEIVVVNDGSTDDTEEMLRSRFGRPEQPEGVRVRWRSCSHQGIAATLNAALEIASGEFVAALGDDDCLTPRAIERCVDTLRAEPDIGLVYTDYARVLDDHVHESLPTMDFDLRVLRRRNYIGWLVMYRRSLHELVGRYDPVLPTHEDWDLWLRICHMYPARHLCESLYLWNEHSERVSTTPRMVRGRELVMQRVASGAYDRPSPSSELLQAVYRGLRCLPLLPMASGFALAARWAVPLQAPDWLHNRLREFESAKYQLDRSGSQAMAKLSLLPRLVAGLIVRAGSSYMHIVWRLRHPYPLRPALSRRIVGLMQKRGQTTHSQLPNSR